MASCFSRFFFIFVAVSYNKCKKKMKIYYKEREIDYERTLGEMAPGEQIEINTAGRDLANIRIAVCRAARRFPDHRSFRVNKVTNGATVRRVE